MTLIGLIRHGSTVWNKEGRAQGNSDIQTKGRLKNTSITTLRKVSDLWECDVYNCTIHLDKGND